jgi:hypothetical protein
MTLNQAYQILRRNKKLLHYEFILDYAITLIFLCNTELNFEVFFGLCPCSLWAELIPVRSRTGKTAHFSNFVQKTITTKNKHLIRYIVGIITINRKGNNNEL